MMKLKWPCSRCELEFETNDELKNHRCAGSPLLAKKKMMEMDMELPPEVVKQAEELKRQRQSGNIPPTKPKPKPKPKQPLKLVYKYEGGCTMCDNSSIETIEIDVPNKKNKTNVVAWCPNCKHQLLTKEVSKLYAT